MVAKKSEIPAHRYRALVVDDSQIARYILTGALSRQVFGVEVADSAWLQWTVPVRRGSEAKDRKFKRGKAPPGGEIGRGDRGEEGLTKRGLERIWAGGGGAGARGRRAMENRAEAMTK